MYAENSTTTILSGQKRTNFVGNCRLFFRVAIFTCKNQQAYFPALCGADFANPQRARKSLHRTRGGYENSAVRKRGKLPRAEWYGRVLYWDESGYLGLLAQTRYMPNGIRYSRRQIRYTPAVYDMFAKSKHGYGCALRPCVYIYRFLTFDKYAQSWVGNSYNILSNDNSEHAEILPFRRFVTGGKPCPFFPISNRINAPALSRGIP